MTLLEKRPQQHIEHWKNKKFCRHSPACATHVTERVKLTKASETLAHSALNPQRMMDLQQDCVQLCNASVQIMITDNFPANVLFKIRGIDIMTHGFLSA